jgi:hypothetical protein
MYLWIPVGFSWCAKKTLLWIRIRIDLAVLDPDPYIENAAPDPGAWKLTEINKST